MKKKQNKYRGEYAPHLNFKFNSYNDPVECRVERTYKQLENDYDIHFGELNNNFTALYGKLSMDDPYAIPKYSTAFDVGNQVLFIFCYKNV
jgi:hypothetical protein